MPVSENPVATPSSTAAEPDEVGKQAAQASIPAAAEGLRVDISELKSSYCNVCNANITREEVVLNFGVNHDWDRAHAGQIDPVVAPDRAQPARGQARCRLA